MAAERVPAMEIEAVRSASGTPFARLFWFARSELGNSTRRLLNLRCVSLVVWLGVPTTVLTFLLRAFSSMQTARRRRALADVAMRRRQQAHDNIMAARAQTDESANSTETQRTVLSLGFLELQKKLREGEITAQTVLASYRAQAGRAHVRVNCLTEFLPEAVQAAQVGTKVQRLLLVGLVFTVRCCLCVCVLLRGYEHALFVRVGRTSLALKVACWFWSWPRGVSFLRVCMCRPWTSTTNHPANLSALCMAFQSV